MTGGCEEEQGNLGQERSAEGACEKVAVKGGEAESKDAEENVEEEKDGAGTRAEEEGENSVGEEEEEEEETERSEENAEEGDENNVGVVDDENACELE